MTTAAQIKTLDEILMDLDLGKVDVLFKNMVGSLTKPWMVDLMDWQHNLSVTECGETPMAAIALAVFRLNLKRDKIGLTPFSPIADVYIV